jgi:hypothetical protein
MAWNRLAVVITVREPKNTLREIWERTKKFVQSLLDGPLRVSRE